MNPLKKENFIFEIQCKTDIYFHLISFENQDPKFHIAFNQRLSVSVTKRNENPPTCSPACLMLEIFCMSLPKCVLPFLTNQVAQLSHVVI